MPMKCTRTDLKKDKNGKYSHKACSSQSTTNKACRECCNCKHPEDGSRKRVTCKDKCDKKLKSYAPEPSSQYELDSFEIGTESAVCEDCGEIHGLDEYELEPHDEYEEVACKHPKKKVADGKTKLGFKKYKCVLKTDSEIQIYEKAMENNPNYNKKLPQASKKGRAGGQGTYKVSDKNKAEPHPTAMRNKKSNIDKNQKGGTAKNKLTFGSSTYEPIPDYIMRALQPKKSIHTEYGKLRY